MKKIKKLENIATESDFRRSKIAAELGSLGGQETLRKYGKEHFSEIRKLRDNKNK